MKTPNDCRNNSNFHYNNAVELLIKKNHFTHSAFLEIPYILLAEFILSEKNEKNFISQQMIVLFLNKPKWNRKYFEH